MLSAFESELWSLKCGPHPHFILWVTPLTILIVACSMADSCCLQGNSKMLVIPHCRLQCQDQLWPKRHSLGSTSVCSVATLIPQLAFDSTVFRNLTVACFFLVCIHEIHSYIFCTVLIHTIPMKVILTSRRPLLCLLQVQWPGRLMT